jgi:hypothetical protein
MRRRLSFAFVAASLALSAVALAGEEKIKGPWDGLGVGSFVHQKTSSKTAGGGMPDMPAQVTESKQTLIKITDDVYTVKNETKMGDDWQGMEIPWPRKAPVGPGVDVKEPKVEELGTEKVSVDGTDVSCKKTKTTVEGMTTTAWTNEKYGVVKSESSGSGTTMEMALTKLSAKAKIGAVEVEYREMTSTTKTGALDMKTKIWLSDAVPGGMLRTESTTAMPGGMTTTSVTETIAFEKK